LEILIMAKLLSAVVASTVHYGREEKKIKITVEGEPSFVYRKITFAEGNTAYLGVDGPFARFFVHVHHNETGFGGDTFRLRMEDGTESFIKGPWSSAASTMNELFELEDPLVEVLDVTTYRGGVVAHVRKSALDELGIALKLFSYGHTDSGFWIPA
jgi:hypothetical protein